MHIVAVMVAIAIGMTSAYPQYYRRDAPHHSGGYGGSPVYSPAQSRSHSTSNHYGHDFGYDVQDPHYNNYQGRQETASGNDVRGSYYLMEADGSMRRVDYVATHPGGFVATVSDKHGSKTYGNNDYVPDDSVSSGYSGGGQGAAGHGQSYH